MSISYFRRQAEQCYRHAHLFTGRQADRTIIDGLGDEFVAKASAAVARLAQMRDAVARRREVEPQVRREQHPGSKEHRHDEQHPGSKEHRHDER